MIGFSILSEEPEFISKDTSHIRVSPEARPGKCVFDLQLWVPGLEHCKGL